MSRALAVAAAVAAVGLGSAATSAPAATHARTFLLYGKASKVQFVNHADDRARGTKTNPFNAEVLPTPPGANSGKKGARAGDNALFTITLYSDRKFSRQVGTATFDCTFNFDQEAVCEANYDLNRGTMIAMGPAKLDGSDITLAVVGGTGTYSGAHGQVTTTYSRSIKNAQLLRFQLV